MTQYLPPNLMGLFAPREPIPFKPPLSTKPRLKRNYSGIASSVYLFENPCDTPEPTKIISREEKIRNKLIQRLLQGRKQAELKLMEWDPNLDPNISGDPYKTLFVSRLTYDVNESKLKQEFKHYGHLKKITLIHDKNSGKFRGYAFIEFEHERDMHAAYKKCDGIKINGRRILVDVERGRTVKNWRPRYLGGGLGGGKRAQKN